MKNSDVYFMSLALREAEKAFKEDEVPVGAILVNNFTHEVVAFSHNTRENRKEISGHAEINVINEALKILNKEEIKNTTLYVTLEPCSMCAGAIIQSGISRLVFGAFEKESGFFGSKADITKIMDSKMIVEHSVLEEESLKLLKEFFLSKR